MIKRTSITLTKGEAIAMLLKANPDVDEFIIEESDINAWKRWRRFKHVENFHVENLAFVEINTLDNICELVYEDGTRSRSTYTLKESLNFVKRGIWKEIS